MESLDCASFLGRRTGQSYRCYGDFLSLKKVVFFGRGDGAERLQKHSFFDFVEPDRLWFG